jgi:hypothetical protein
MPLQDEFNDAADEWFALEEGSFPLVPRSSGDGLIAVRATVDLPVLDTPGFQKRPDAIKAALLILSQSPTGRKLAAAAIAAGYRIYVDPPSLSGAGPEYEDGTYGSTDHVNRRINSAGDQHPLHLALTLAHELAHVSQIINGGLDIQVSALHPLASIRQLLAMEGDARAYEFLVAAELQYPAKDDPGERLLFQGALDAVAKTIGVSLAPRVIDLAKPALEQGGDKAEWMARIFKCFYASPALREHYENTILHAVETLEREQPGSLADAALFRGEMTQQELVSRIDGHGVTYLVRHVGKYIDLDAPQMAAVSPRTQQRLLDFEALRHQNPRTQDDRSWKGTVFQLVPAPPPPRPPAP